MFGEDICGLLFTDCFLLYEYDNIYIGGSGKDNALETKKWNIGWGAVSECNMNCQFCYSKKGRELQSTVGLAEWKSFIQNNHHLTNSINYGTGENSLSVDWFELINFIRDNYPNIGQALTTNGYISHQVSKNDEFDVISKKCIDEIDVSLDFADSNKHNFFRGNNNAYAWAINTLKYCDENGISATIVFLGTNDVLDIQNIKGLFSIAKTYNAKLRMNIFRPSMGHNAKSTKFIASYSRLLDVLKWISDNQIVLSLSDPLFCAILTDGMTEIDHSGKDSIRILHDGYITPSTYLISDEFKRYSILNNITIEGLDFDETIIPEACSQCNYLDRCGGGVVDRRYLWYKDLNVPDPYCPFREENYLPDFKIKIDDTIPFHSIHYGYLPTFFFAAK